MVKQSDGRGGGDDVDEALVDRWIGELRKLVVGGQVDLMARVGQFLVENVYGSLEEARARRPRKTASVRRLAERAEEFGMRPSSLARAVPMYLQVQLLGQRLSSRLTVEHHRALLPLRDESEKKQLAEKSAEVGWTSDELRKQLRRVQRPHAGGRPARPAVSLLVDRVDRVLVGASASEIKVELGELDQPEVRRLIGRVNAAQSALERIERQLQRQLGR